MVAQHAGGCTGRNSTLLPPPGWPLKPPAFDIKSTFSGLEGQVIHKEPGLNLLFFKRFLKAPERASLLKYLLEELPWYRDNRKPCVTQASLVADQSAYISVHLFSCVHS
jgi:hypothetical protein